MADTTPPQKKAQPKVTLREVLTSLDALSPEDRDKLMDLGATFPNGVRPEALDQPSGYGYRCPHCNGVALVFHGTQFGRVRSPLPMGGQTLSELAWTQPLKPGQQTDRRNPTCPSCGALVALGPSQSLLASYILENVGAYTASIDQAYSQQARSEFRRKSAEAMAKHGAGIGDASQNYDSKANASDLMTEQQRADIEFVVGNIPDLLPAAETAS